MKPQLPNNILTNCPSHFPFDHHPPKSSTYKHSIQWNLDSPTQPLQQQESHFKEDQQKTIENPEGKKVDKKVMGFLLMEKQIHKKSKSYEEDTFRDEFNSELDEPEISQKQQIKKENKRLSQYLRKMMRQNKQINHEIIALTQQIKPLNIPKYLDQKSQIDMNRLIRENQQLKISIKSLVTILNQIREKIQVAEKIDILFESLVPNTNEASSESALHPTLKEKIQIILSSKSQNLSNIFQSQQKLTFKHSQHESETLGKLKACETFNKELQAKCEDLDQQNEELYQRIKSLDRMCIMKREKYEENIENLMKSYEDKIRQMTAIISVAQYDEQVNFIKSQNERLSLLLEEKGSTMLRMKEKMIKILDKIEQLQLENAELYSQLREGLHKIDGHEDEEDAEKRMSVALKDQKQENERLKCQIHQLQESLQKKTKEGFEVSLGFKQIKEKIIPLETHIDELKKINLEIRDNLNQKINHNRYLEGCVSHLTQEFMKLSQCLPKIRQERDKMLNQIKKYSIENSELKLEIRRLSKTQLIKFEFDA